MATPRQIAANRRNAQKSTGPRTAAGKAVTRLNSLRDGFTGQVTTLSDEDRPVFENLKAELISDLAPMTVMELRLASAIAWDTWRLDRLRAVELNMYALAADDPETAVECDNAQVHTALTAARAFTVHADRFVLMSLYEQRLNRNLHKNLATLRAMQAQRKAHYKAEIAEEVILARYSDFKGLAYKAPDAPTENGSVFSNEDVFAAANRMSTLEVARNEIWKAPYKVQFAAAGTSGSGPDAANPLPASSAASAATRISGKPPASEALNVRNISSARKRHSTKS